jgi:signal transduction histidine kinase
VIDACEDARGRSIDALRELTNFAIMGAVGTVDAAMRALEQGGTEVVVTDVELPDGDYRDVIEAAKRRTPTPTIVVFSASDAPELERKSIAAGADLFLCKSAGLEELQRGVLDLSPRRRRRDSESDRWSLLGRLTAGVAHDLANYLHVIDGSLALAERSGASRDITRARKAIDSTTSLLGSLLAYVRGGAPAPSVVDLRDIVTRVLEVFARAIPDHIVVVLDLQGAEVAVRGVAAELEQLLLNLVLNAVDAMPHGGELRISLGRDADTIRLDVADRGAGGIPTVTPHGVAASRKRERTGGGLGLGIVRSVVDRHAAVLRIVHRASGGTRVQVTFPPA